MKKVKQILFVLTVIAVLAVAVGFCVTLFKPSTKEFARFVLRYEDNLVTDTADVVFPRKAVKVQARHVFEFAESDTKFTVKVVPNPKADFTFTVGATSYRFSDVDDLTPAFDIELAADGFTMDLSETTTKSVLDKLFIGAVTLPDDYYNKAEDFPFCVQATAANGATVSINFRAQRIPVTGIGLVPSEGVIYF